jgi:hypothetical protein
MSYSALILDDASVAPFVVGLAQAIRGGRLEGH